MIEIRKATKEDVPALLALIKGLARHHEVEQYLLATESSLLEAGFGEQAKMGALIAEYNGQPVGYVSYTINYSIWVGRDFMLIDDVFALEQYRGKGIGQQLMEAIRSHALDLGLNCIKWQVEKDNTGAIRFYERLGAKLNIKGIFTWHIDPNNE